MKAIILAAGRGSRLKQMTQEKPKCLTCLGCRTLLDWQLKALKKSGIQEVAIVRGYQGHLLPTSLSYFENPRWAETNMVISLSCATPWLEQDTCLISYADIVYPADTVRKLIVGQGDIVLTYNTQWRSLWESRFIDPLSDAETFQVDRAGRLLEIGNRANTLAEIQGQYMGLLKITPIGWAWIKGFLAAVPEQQDKLDMTRLLQKLILQNVPIYTVPIEGHWLEVDTESDYELYTTWLGEKLTHVSWMFE